MESDQNTAQIPNIRNYLFLVLRTLQVPFISSVSHCEKRNVNFFLNRNYKLQEINSSKTSSNDNHAHVELTLKTIFQIQLGGYSSVIKSRSINFQFK